MLNLDTHILIHFFRGDLTIRERKLVEKHQNELVIADIVLWEIAKLHSKKRIKMDLRSPQFLKLITFLKIIPISSEIAATSISLDFSADPADELICATSVVHKIPLLTRDERILRSKVVPFA